MHVGAGVEEHRHGLGLLPRAGPGQRRKPTAVARFEVGAGGQQQLYHLMWAQKKGQREGQGENTPKKNPVYLTFESVEREAD